MKAFVSLLLIIQPVAHAGLPSYDSFALQQLVSKAEDQLKAAQELVEFSKKDSTSLDKAEHTLDQLAMGLDQSIKSYQGTKTYASALLKLQSEPGFISGREKVGSPQSRLALDRFQTTTVSANAADLENQSKLQEALLTAKPGFVPKVQAQAAIGAWQTDIRSSAQLTQILATLNGMREDMNGHGSTGINALLEGAQSQNDKLREGVSNAPR